jgi:YggT family protein
MIPLMSFFAQVITFCIVILVISAILSWLIAFDVVNRRNQFVYVIADTMQRLTEPALRPIRNILPDFGALDLSPLVLFFGLLFIRDVLIRGWICGGLCG